MVRARACCPLTSSSSQLPDQQVVGSMQFELIDFRRTYRLCRVWSCNRVARLLVKICRDETGRSSGRLASVYPKPEETFNAAQALHNLVNKRVMYAFCRRAVNPASPTEQVPMRTVLLWQLKQSQTIIYHLDLFFVPTGWFQTECHYNGVDGKLLKAGLVHNRQDHLEVMHIGGFRASTAGNGKEN
uniref:HORMA domain-containing protein n=1 Tax=Macrostomum lignano TaxID=282301 RepID=A0A1I8FBA6_9PLAT